MRPAENMGQPHGNGHHRSESENDGAQGAPRAVDDEDQRHQEDPEQGQEAHRRRSGLPLEPRVEPRRSDAPHHGEWATGSLEGQGECVDGLERLIALGGRIHPQLDGDSQKVIAQQACAAKQRGAGCKGMQVLGFLGTDLPRGIGAAVKIEQAVNLDPRNLGEFVLELVGGAQRGKAQRIRRLEHDERLLAFRKQPIEFGRGARHRIARHDQPLDRRVIGDLQGAVDARGREYQERAGNPAAHSQNAGEKFYDFGRARHSRSMIA